MRERSISRLSSSIAGTRSLCSTNSSTAIVAKDDMVNGKGTLKRSHEVIYCMRDDCVAPLVEHA